LYKKNRDGGMFTVITMNTDILLNPLCQVFLACVVMICDELG